MVILLWASKFATAKIECSFKMGKNTPLGGTIYFAVDRTYSRYTCPLKIRTLKSKMKLIYTNYFILLNQMMQLNRDVFMRMNITKPKVL